MKPTILRLNLSLLKKINYYTLQALCLALIGLPAILGCNGPKDQYERSPGGPGVKITQHEFIQLLNGVSEGWNSNNAEAAAACFTKDAVYIEPPDQQLYRGRDELFEFFGGEEGRATPMHMTWHYLVFDEASQVGTGEYTFAYKGRLTHGIVIVQVAGGKIRRWREYQYRSTQAWADFIGPSEF